MGFYSFYKILKDIIRTIFGKKFLRGLLIIFILVALLSFFKYNVTYADSDLVITVNGVDYTLDSSISQFKNIVFVQNGSRITSIVSNDKILANLNNQGYFYTVGSTGTWYNFSTFNVSTLSNITISNYTSYSSSQSLTYGLSGSPSGIVYSNCAIYDYNNPNDILIDAPTPPFVAPHFDNTDTDIQNLSFEWLYIDPADYGIEDNLYLHILNVNRTIEINTNETAYYYDDVVFKLNKNSRYLQNFANDESYPYYSIPKYKLSLNVDIQYIFALSSSGSSITSSVGLITDQYDDNIFQTVSVNTSGLLSQADVNSDNLKNIDDALNGDGNDNDTLTDSDLALPEMNVDDPTNTGFMGFFTILYNGFCTGEVTPVVLDLPFINKTLTIDPDLTYNIMTKTEFLPLYAIIQSFYWYIISRFILLTIRDIVLHIKNIDFDVKNMKGTGVSDIGGDML